MKINKKLISAFAAAIFLISNLILAAPANAADKGYRYWGYYQAAPGATSWTAAMTGPTVDIADGSVEGWSFVFSSDDVPSIAPAGAAERSASMPSRSRPLVAGL